MGPRKPAKLDESGLWDYALRILGRKSYSAAEIRRKLALRAAEPGAVSAVLGKLREYGYADDEKFAEAFAANRLRNEGFGQSRVLRDLRAKMVPAKIAEQAAAKTFADQPEAELIDKFLARKYRSKDLTEFLREEKNLASAYRKLRVAGFSSALCLTALKRHSQRAADLDIEDNEPVEEP